MPAPTNILPFPAARALGRAASRLRLVARDDHRETSPVQGLSDRHGACAEGMMAEAEVADVLDVLGARLFADNPALVANICPTLVELPTVDALRAELQRRIDTQVGYLREQNWFRFDNRVLLALRHARAATWRPEFTAGWAAMRAAVADVATEGA